ncbi:response regulator transcription factor [Paenibacillus sp. 1P07SE]|uniref:response regulator transcription factor n=1 Tax=Paenibacillus sp. 1P07SE TaxID=3132209 RepID=UPI0039A6496C
MLQVLVVDDELRQRRILSNLIREYHSEYEVFEAQNGEEALSLCLERKMDIVFSDIRMPKLDGLRMIESICEQNPELKIVIVSGYSDFEYARKALHLRVQKYILKPIQPEGIRETLRQLKEEISRERHSRLENETMAEQVYKLRPLYCDYLMNKWMNGECTPFELQEIETLVHAPGQGCAIVIRLSRPGSNGLETTAEAWNTIKWDARNGLTELLPPFGHCVSYFLHQNTNAVASLLRFDSADKIDTARLQDELSQLAMRLSGTFGIKATVGIGQSQLDIFSAVQEAILTAETALRSHFYNEDRLVFCYSEPAYPSDEFKGLQQFQDECMPLAYGQKPVNPAAVDQILGRLLGDGRPDPELLLDCARTQLLQLIQGARNIIPGAAADALARTVDMLLDPVRCVAMTVFKAHLLVILEETSALIQTQRENKNNIVMERCLHYVHSHLGEEISFEDLAKRFYFHPSYFSTLFKKYTGMPFTEYLTRLRVETAHSILRNSDKKVYEVAREVGYRDVKYFTKLYKKHYGLTPEEGRKFGDRGAHSHGE